MHFRYSFDIVFTKEFQAAKQRSPARGTTKSVMSKTNSISREQQEKWDKMERRLQEFELQAGFINKSNPVFFSQLVKLYTD